MRHLSLIFLLALAACSPSSQPQPNPIPDPDPTPVSRVPEVAFPRGLAVASPLQVTQLIGAGSVRAQGAAPSRAYQNDLNDIESVLSGTSPSLIFRSDAFFLKPGRAGCFGPTLLYQNHPDGGGSGELPGGDLGIWFDNDLHIVGSSITFSNEACAAAQLNTRLTGISNQGKAALVLAATMAANASSLPSAGSSTDVTAALNALDLSTVRFNSAVIAQSSAGNWSYALNMDVNQSGSWRAVVVSLTHNPTSSGYSGILSYRADVVSTGGNCGPGSNNQTLVGSMKYAKTSSTNLGIQSRSALFCSFGQNGLDSAGLVDPSKSWSDDFNAFTADFDPNSYTGSYSYVWQAGNGDANSRVLNLRLNDPASGETISRDGESYYGYGDRVQTDSDLVGDVTGFYCDWAGPKPSGGGSGFAEYAQRQFVSYDSDKNVFVVPTGGSDIRYAPTQSCLNTSSTFKYDRNLNHTFDETADELTVTPRGTGATTDLDLLQPSDTNSDGTATIEEAIAGRGWIAPRVP